MAISKQIASVFKFSPKSTSDGQNMWEHRMAANFYHQIWDRGWHVAECKHTEESWELSVQLHWGLQRRQTGTQWVACEAVSKWPDHEIIFSFLVISLHCTSERAQVNIGPLADIQWEWNIMREHKRCCANITLTHGPGDEEAPGHVLNDKGSCTTHETEWTPLHPSRCDSLEGRQLVVWSPTCTMTYIIPCLPLPSRTQFMKSIICLWDVCTSQSPSGSIDSFSVLRDDKQSFLILSTITLLFSTTV